jgi:hypothetical protein
MKRQALSLISLLSVLLVAGLASAQTSNVRANVPFNFTVGSNTLPAGAYDIRNVSTSGANTLLLQARDGNSSMIVSSNAAETFKPADRTKLVFNRYRDQYFLAEIWVEGATRGRQLPKTSREKELAKELAQDLTHQRVEIVASLY